MKDFLLSRVRTATLVATGIFALLLMSPPLARGDVITEVPSEDTALFARSDSVNVNNGTADRFWVGQFGASPSDDYGFSILSWSLASVPSGDVASTDGSLALTLVDGAGEGGNFDGQIIDIYLIAASNAGWLELQATWNNLNMTVPTAWTGGPGLGDYDTGEGYSASPIASYTWGSPGVDGPSSFSITIPQAVLNDWIANPSDNAGILLRRRDENPANEGFLRIQSSRAAVEGDRPTLTFTTVPEPGSVGLMILGSVMLAMRRQRRTT